MPILFPSSPISGQTYSYEAIIWKWNSYAWDKLGLTAEVTSLNGLSDVTISGLQNNDILVYNASSLNWINTQILDGGTY